MAFYIENYGCAANQYDGDIIKTLLAKKGLIEVSKPNEADIIILNTCIVKKATEDRMRERIRNLSKLNKTFIVTGCMAEALSKKILYIAPNANIIGLNYIDMFPEILEKISKGEKIVLTGKRSLNRVALDYNPSSKLIATLPIAQGCLGSCSFCITRFARGTLISYPPSEILRKIRKLIEKGYKEIRLTGQDIGPYGQDLGINLVDLLEEICKIEGFFKVRIGMASPDTIKPIFDDLLNLMSKCDKIYKFLHIPVQSGSERILRLMNRKYSPELFLELVRKARKYIPEITIATDVIVAFPTETEEDHLATIKLLEITQPDVVNISRYGDRPFTKAAKLRPKIHSGIAKKRSSEVSRLVRNISLMKNRKYVNRTEKALILNHNGLNRLEGRLENYKLVYVDIDKDEFKGLIGSQKLVKITDISWKALYGTII